MNAPSKSPSRRWTLNDRFLDECHQCQPRETSRLRIRCRRHITYSLRPSMYRNPEGPLVWSRTPVPQITIVKVCVPEDAVRNDLTDGRTPFGSVESAVYHRSTLGSTLRCGGSMDTIILLMPAKSLIIDEPTSSAGLQVFSKLS